MKRKYILYGIASLSVILILILIIAFLVFSGEENENLFK